MFHFLLLKKKTTKLLDSSLRVAITKIWSIYLLVAQQILQKSFVYFQKINSMVHKEDKSYIMYILIYMFRSIKFIIRSNKMWRDLLIQYKKTHLYMVYYYYITLPTLNKVFQKTSLHHKNNISQSLFKEPPCSNKKLNNKKLFFFVKYWFIYHYHKCKVEYIELIMVK